MGNWCSRGTAKNQTLLLNENHLSYQMVQSMHAKSYENDIAILDQIGEGNTSKIQKVEMKKSRHHRRMTTLSTNDECCFFPRYFAMKEIDTRTVNAGLLDEFENEIALLKAMDHPRIVKIFQTFRLHRNRVSGILMEICHGGDLFSRPTYSEDEASRIVQQILSAASYLHERNIVHRDLKYQNILFVDKDHLDIKIIDFGLATRQDSGKRNGYSPKCGTLHTMSPETVQGKHTNASTDMWSIGVITYMLLCNQKPFWGESRAEIEYQILTKEIKFEDTDGVWKSISNDAKQFVSSLLQRIPERRPTAKEALQHNFIQRQGSISSPKIDSEVLHKLHDSIQRFIASSDFKKIILQMIASRYPSEEVLDLTHIFTGFDSSKEGDLYFSDFKALLSGFHHSELELQEMFGRIELNNTGRIMYTEFLACTLEMKGPIDDYRTLEIFEQIDRSSQGFMTQNDLRHILPRTITEKELQALMVEVTADDVISFEQFRIAVQGQKQVRAFPLRPQNRRIIAAQQKNKTWKGRSSRLRIN